VRGVLEAVEAKYGVKLPRRVVTVDYGEDVGDLFVKFKHAEHTEGDAAPDGNLIIYYDKKGKITAIEITDITAL